MIKKAKYKILYLAFTVLNLFFVNVTQAEVKPEAYETIKIKQVFSKLITRGQNDRIYSGQIKSEKGVIEFEKTYKIDTNISEINFDRQMLIFGITDNITTRAFQFLKQDKINSFTLDYAETGIEHEYMPVKKYNKRSYVQIFVLENLEGIHHIRVKNLVINGLSKLYNN